MIRQRLDASGERGAALVYTVVFLTTLLLFTGVAVDTGRAYIIKAQLTKAVDGAALGAARMLNSGDPKGEATRIFRANFPTHYMGSTEVTDPTLDPNFFKLETNEEGVHVVTITARAKLPTTFMRVNHFDEVTVSSSGEATRKLVDLSLILDVSSSIGWRWPYVQAAAHEFLDGFDENGDRISLTTYGWGAAVRDQMPSTRGFNKALLKQHIPGTLPGGITPMAEGLYRGWDELRTVPAGQQSALRVIVLFTDGSGNSVPGIFPGSSQARTIFTLDFPKRTPDPDNITSNTPAMWGLYHPETGTRNPDVELSPAQHWTSTATIPSVPYLPLNSTHAHRRSAGIPTSFPLQTNAITVNGTAQQSVRGLTNWNSGAGRYPAHAANIRRAATNLTEIVANAARSDTSGDYKIRIYTIGMGSLVTMGLGPNNETSESVLKRIANDKSSPDYNSGQLEGKYYFALTPADLGPAFQQLHSQIIRLSK